MSLAIILLNWNSAADTIRCVRAIEAWEKLEPTIWVVDNASGDDSVARLRAGCPGARLLVSERNLGFGGGNNLAIRQALEAGAMRLFLLNNDAAVSEAGLAQLMHTLEAHPQAGIVGPLLRDPPPKTGLQSGGGRNPLWHVHTRTTRVPDPAAPYPVDYVPGTAILVAAEVFRRVGLLDEGYFFSGEIADFCLRARRQGYQSLIDPSVSATHDTGRSSELRVALYTYYSLRNRFLLARGLYPRWRFAFYLYWGLFALMSIVGSRLRGRRRRAAALSLALRHGLRGQFGDRNQDVLAQDQKYVQESG